MASDTLHRMAYNLARIHSTEAFQLVVAYVFASDYNSFGCCWMSFVDLGSPRSNDLILDHLKLSPYIMTFIAWVHIQYITAHTHTYWIVASIQDLCTV